MLQPPRQTDVTYSAGPTDPIAPLRAALKGHYEIEREIGQGAFATVYLARDLKHERKVAIKVLNADPSSETGELRFIREIRMLARLQHPNILPLHDSGHVEALLYYVMPYVSGDTLRDRIERQRQLPIEDACSIARDVADALAYAHAQGVIHRDIKPENILLSTGHPILADFGIARAIDLAGVRQLTRTGTGSPGTPAYMSPEQLLGDSELDGRSDTYSLGCVLYEMLTGRPPFAGKEGFVKRFTEQPPSVRISRPEIPERIDSAVAKALSRAPHDRFPTASDFAAAFGRKIVDAQEQTPAISASGFVAEPGHATPRPQWSPGAGQTVAELPSERAERRPAPWGQIAKTTALAAVIVAVGLSVLWWRSTLSVTSAVDADRIAVLAPTPERNGVAGRVYSALAQWDSLDLVGDDEVTPQLPSGNLTKSAARTIALRLRAGSFIWHDATASLPGSIRLERIDTKTGNTVRSLLISADDSTANDFAQAVAALLAIPRRPAAADGGDGRTNSYAAWTAYGKAHVFLANWNLDEAEKGFRASIQADPAFAPAHVWLAQVIYWARVDDLEWRDQTMQAARRAADLSERDRALAAGLSALATKDYPAACRAYESLTSKDSLDFMGWLGRGECQALDNIVLANRKSPTGWSFRSSYYSAAGAFMRALSYEPGAHAVIAFQRLQKMLPTAPTQVRIGIGPSKQLFAAYPGLAGDTVGFIPYQSPRFEKLRGKPLEARAEALAQDSDVLREFATDWTRRDPRSSAAYQALADILETQGQISGTQGMSARSAVSRARELARTPSEHIRLRAQSAWLSFKEGRFSGARAEADSALNMASAPAVTDARALVGLAALTGNVRRTAELARITNAFSVSNATVPEPVKDVAAQFFTYAALGICGQATTALETQLVDRIAAYVPKAQQTQLSTELRSRPLSMLGECGRGRTVLGVETGGDTQLEMEAAFSRGDFGRVRVLLDDTQRDLINQRPGDLSLDFTYEIAWLRAAIGDTAAAARQLDHVLNALPSVNRLALRETASAAAVVRAMAMRAELAAARGDHATAVKWAHAVVDLWGNSDPLLAPTTNRMHQIISGKAL